MALTENMQDSYSYPIQEATKAEVQARYFPQGDQKDGQLQLVPGDIVWVLAENEGWCGGHKEGDENTGWFPLSVIRKLQRGDCIDEEEEERKNSALFTSDHRAIASPQAKHRKVSAAQAELAETKQRLEAAEAERSRLDEQVKALQKAHGESENERQRLLKKCDDFQNKAQSLQDECKRKEEELRLQKDQHRQAEERCRLEKNRTSSLEGKLKELEGHCRKLEADLKNRPDARDESGMSKTTTGISASGHRTPSVPHTVSGVLSGSLQAPPAHGAAIAAASSMAAINQVSPSPLSARQPGGGMGSRHASPRHGTSWMPPMGSSSCLPPSPHLRQRVPSSHDLIDGMSHAQQPVATILSNIETQQRSTSRGPTIVRDGTSNVFFRTAASNPSNCPVRQVASVMSSSHVAVTSSTHRAGSREAHMHVSRTHPRVVTPSSSRTAFHQVEDPETPSSSQVTHIEDTSRNFGMSPIGKREQPRGQQYMLPRGGTGPSLMQYSPTRTTSVQDRVRMFESKSTMSTTYR